jgi:hypothetical protein
MLRFSKGAYINKGGIYMLRMLNYVIGNHSRQFGKEITKAMQTEQKQAIKEIYTEERKECADQARKLFKTLCHAGKIRKEQQKALRSLIETLLGSYAAEYKGKHYDNEFHRLYTYLKAYHLDNSDWDKIMTALEEIQKSS